MGRIFASVSLVVLAAAAAPASAQTAEGRADDLPTDIIVTAQKSDQRLQDVPLSITAVTGEQLEARGVSSLKEMQYSIPGLSSVDYGPGKDYVQIRGISNSLGAPTIGIYLDEMPVTADQQQASVDIRLLDMERVEVLRGPQGTLYGEGSMGGTIRYIAAAPKLQEFSGSVTGQVGAIRGGDPQYKVSGVVNIPLVRDVVGLRVVAGYERDGGWIDNRLTGARNVNGATIKTVRAKLLVEPDDATRISALYLHQELDQNNQNFGIGRTTTRTVDTFNRDRYDLVNGVLTHDFGAVELVQSLGYLDRRAASQSDLTPFYLPVLEGSFGVPPGAITRIPFGGPAAQRILSNETRLSSKRSGPFRWTAGFFYRDGKFRQDLKSATAPGLLPLTLLGARSRYRNRSWAVFGEAEYQPVDKLSVLVGLRYFEDRRRFESSSVSFGFETRDSGKATFHALNPRFNLRYTFSPTSMVYANVAKGFRSGGFNLTSAGGGTVPISPTYAPEKLWTYEVGTKHQLFDRKLQIEGAVYYTDWNDVQSYFFAPGSAITVTTNGGKVTGWGVDGAASWRIVPGLTLSGTFGWNNLAYATTTADKRKGDPVDFAAHNSASASLDFRRPVTGNWDGFARVDYQHVGKAQITLRNFGNQIIRMPSRDLVNLRAGLDMRVFEIAVFADNVFDSDAPLIPGPFGVNLENLEQRPRTIGLSVSAQF